MTGPTVPASGPEGGAVLLARCENLIEPDGVPCPGRLRYRWGMSQAACDTCGAWCGVAVADWLSVVADTTAGEADCGCGGTGIRQFDSDGYEACPVHLRRALAGPDDTPAGRRLMARGAPQPVDGCCPACGKFVLLALRSEPPQWACTDIDCVHGKGHPLPPGVHR